MKRILTITFVLIPMLFVAQTKIEGMVTTAQGNPIEGANIYLQGTYDGTTSDVDGHFSFLTSEQGTLTLILSYLSFETYKMTEDVHNMNHLQISLKEDVNALDAVVLSAGTFKAGDNSKINALKPLDVVTTASALGDFVGALQTLPGTSTVAEDGRLFVRGGNANETQIFIDGIRVFTPYTPTTNNAPTRGRYSPFLFDGITFSTGGYSAEYGQALSGVLLLNTIDEPDQNKTDIGIMSLGATLGNTQKWDSGSLSMNMSYINLAPYNAIFPNRNNFIDPYEALSGELVFRKKTNNGLLKLYSAYSNTGFELTQEDINNPQGAYFKLKNNNGYVNTSYCGVLKHAWSIQGGLGYTRDTNSLILDDNHIDGIENSFHGKLNLKKRFSKRLILHSGIEYFNSQFTETFSNEEIDRARYGYRNNIAAVFSEMDIFISKKLAYKIGLRTEYSELLHDFNLAPRLSVAYKTSKKSQLSLAYGDFYQMPSSQVLKYHQDLQPQEAKHYILNYQFNADGKIFRAEAFHKTYDNLVKYDTDFPGFDSQYSNLGNAYARGIDLFWRDNRSLQNVDYWISYSYLDTQRNDSNYPQRAQPGYANKHNLSLVGKYWIEDWRSQLGLSYTFSSGRPYTNPNRSRFLNDRTKPYNSLSINWAYLISQQKILYASVNNILGFRNVNGYQYANSPDTNGTFNRRALLPAADQFFFIGFFWTLSTDNKSNQLDNL